MVTNAHPCSHLLTLRLMSLCREQQQLCSCRSAGGYTLSYLQAQSAVQRLEPWQPPPRCKSVATASCWRSVSASGVIVTLYCIITISHTSFFFLILWSESWLFVFFASLSVVQYPGMMSCPGEIVCCAFRASRWHRSKISLWLRAAAAATAAVQVTPDFTAAVRIWMLTAPPLTTRGHSSTRIHLYPVCSVLCYS